MSIIKKKTTVLLCLLLLASVFVYFFTHIDLPIKEKPNKSVFIPPLHHPFGRTVLVIYSYHNTLPWQAKIRTSLYANLEKVPLKQYPELYEEYFDALRFDSLENYDGFLAFLQKKYKHVKLDLVITESDLAYQFLKKHSEFLSHVPRLHILTDSLDKPDNSNNLLKALPNTKQAVLTVTKVLPKLRRLVVIGNSNLVSDSKLNPVKAQDIYEIKQLIPQLAKQRIQLEILPLLSFAELSQTVAQINSPNTVLLYFPVEIDRLGERKIPKLVLHELAQLAHVPIFVHHDSLLDAGSVGGYLLSADKIGNLMADAVLGKPLPKNSAEIEQLTSGYYFNDSELKRWHIPDSDLPPGSIIVNRPIPDWYKYRWQIAGTFTAILFELGLIIALLHNLRLRKQAVSALKQERDLLEQRVSERTCELKDSEAFTSSILDSLQTYIAVVDGNGIIIAVNQAWRNFVKQNSLFSDCQYTVGLNYFGACSKTANLSELNFIQSEIKKILAGVSNDFTFEYPCHALTEQRWFFMRVSPLQSSKKGAVISYENITKRKQAELQQQALIRRNQILMDNALEGIHILDEKGCILETNKAFYQMLGYSEQELLRLSIFDIEANLSKTEIENNLANFLYSYGVFETKLKRKDHSIIDVEVSVVGVNLEGKQCLYSSAKNISKRKATESLLQLHSTILQSLAEGVMLIRSDNYEIQFVTSQFVQMFGYQDENELIGLQVTHLNANTTDKTAEQEAREIIAALEQHNFWSGEVCNVKKDGTVFWCHASVSSFEHREFGKLWVSVHTDITERKQAELELQESENRYRTLIEMAGDALFVADVETGKIIDCNAKACLLIGREKQDIIGLHQSQLHPADRIEEYRQLFQKGSAVGRTFISDVLVLHQDGHTIPVDISSNTFDLNGKKVIVGLFHDISEHKQMEQFLLEAKQAAERANHFKSEFLANMSHEIRTPMNAILGFSEILNDLITDNTQRYYLDAIHRSGKTLLQLINDILDLSKIEAGKFDLQYTPTSLKTLLNDMQIVFSQKASEKNLDFTIVIDEKLPEQLLLDETRLRQILLNLIGNAVKFTTVGFIKIIVLFYSIDYETINLTIEIHDSGVGIPKEQQEKIFLAFSQQDDQSTEYGGTGLGLTITKRLLELMRGTISVESEIGQGSCFTLKLPKIKIIKQNPQPLNSLPILLYHFKPAQILLVDDIEQNRQLIKCYLQDFQELTLVEAETGTQAIALAGQRHFDLILMDRRLPDISGDAVCKQIKDHPDCVDIPIIMITASILTPTAQEIGSAFDCLLAKPLQKADLLSKLQLFLALDENTRITTICENLPSTDAEQVISVENPTELLELLQSSYQPRITKLAESAMFPIDDYIDLAEELMTMAKQYHYPLLYDWAITLKSQTELFDLDNLPKTLREFNNLLAQL